MTIHCVFVTFVEVVRRRPRFSYGRHWNHIY